jgi:hypothetical protein
MVADMASGQIKDLFPEAQTLKAPIIGLARMSTRDCISQIGCVPVLPNPNHGERI